ncbi:uncharacterized protein TNCV_1000441 [Trichonephila clavipes]|nr:uncharacterized protein TNCV_1000441 [Trichonephila clavipes]
MGVTKGQTARDYLDTIDSARFLRAEKTAEANCKEAITLRRALKAAEKDNFEETEGLLYAPATLWLLATDHVILNHGQVTWTTPEMAPPLLTTTPDQREDVSALDRFSVHRCPTRRVFSGTGLELMTMPATIRYLYHSAPAATVLNVEGNYFEGDNVTDN